MSYPRLYAAAVKYGHAPVREFLDAGRETRRRSGEFDHTVVGVAADRLEEAGDPLAPVYRRHYDTSQENPAAAPPPGLENAPTVALMTPGGGRLSGEYLSAAPHPDRPGHVYLSHSDRLPHDADAYPVIGLFTNAEARDVLHALRRDGRVNAATLDWFDRHHPVAGRPR